MAKTKEERFLIKLYELESSLENPKNAFDVGSSIGESPKFVKLTVRILAQCNFIKKINDELIFITEHGKTLAKSLSGK